MNTITRDQREDNHTDTDRDTEANADADRQSRTNAYLHLETHKRQTGRRVTSTCLGGKAKKLDSSSQLSFHSNLLTFLESLVRHQSSFGSWLLGV